VPAIDRGEGHPINQRGADDLPQPARPATMPAGLQDLAQVLGTRRRQPAPPGQPGRLVLEHGPGLIRLMAAYSGRPEIAPHPRLNPGEGLGYRMVEGAARDSLGPGGWRLLDDGEVVGSGTVAVG